MPRAAKISMAQLRAEIARGASDKEIAKKYGVDPSNVWRMKKKLAESAAAPPPVVVVYDDPIADEATAQGVAVPSPAPHTPHRTGLPADADEESMWNARAALDRNYADLCKLLDSNRFLTDSKTRKSIIAEKRAHIALGVQIKLSMYNIQETSAFQDLVLRILDGFEPGVRAAAIAELQQMHADWTADRGGKSAVRGS